MPPSPCKRRKGHAYQLAMLMQKMPTHAPNFALAMAFGVPKILLRMVYMLYRLHAVSLTPLLDGVEVYAGQRETTKASDSKIELVNASWGGPPFQCPSKDPVVRGQTSFKS